MSTLTGRVDTANLDGRALLVTGGAQGIGRSIAVQGADRGARVVVAGLDEAKGTDTGAEIAFAALWHNLARRRRPPRSMKPAPHHEPL